MSQTLRTSLVAAAFAATLTNAYAQSTQKIGYDLQLPKEVLHEQMRDVAQMIETLKSQGASERRITELRAHYDAISAHLGGDDPARLQSGGVQFTPTQTSGVALLSAPTCGAAATTTNVPGVGGPITPPTPAPPFTGTTFTANVSGVGAYLWDVNLNTAINHTFCGDLDIFLESPSGTSVVISTDNAAGNDNCFNGTTWDDNVNNPCVDFAFVNNVVAPSLSPEGRLAAFRGEDPNGTWTMRIFDDAGVDIGNVNSFSLDVSTLTGAPVEATTNFTESPAAAIPDNGNLSRVLAVGGVGTYLSKVNLFVEITHTECQDLDITLTSPGGTIVKVTTDNGAALDNVFNGTLFDHDNLVPVTDQVFTNNVAVANLSPEGAFDNFLGQDPNGNWTLSITDDLATDLGTLVRWDLNVTTTTAPAPAGPTNFAGTTGPIPDFVAAPPPTLVPTVYTTLVSGVGTSLWDVDLSTVITHTASADLDMTLTSPAGTVIVIATDCGGTFDNCFNGTLWDDNGNDGAADRVYANNVTATPLSPEGRLDGFRGEDPNGTWTLTITDDALADNGTLASWALDVSTLASAPAEASTTISQSPGLAIPDNNTTGVTDVMAVAGLVTNITEVECYIEVPHTFAADLDITLQSPAGTIVKLTTDNGVGNDNVFNGTLFDADAPTAVTDHLFANNVVVPAIQSEGAFGNFKGQDPNGNWSLKCVDDLGIDVGTLVRWDLTIRTCSPLAFNPFCFGDGTLVDHTTPCPCANTGAIGNGCSNSVNPNGANLTASGSAGLDNVVLAGSGMPATVSCIYLQGDGLDDIIFGDGTRCTGGTLLRLRTRANVGGASTFPDSTDTVTLSQRGGVTPGSGARRYYQTYYRNAAPAFCPPETFNVTNGWLMDW